MKSFLCLITATVLFFPFPAFAYRVPEREYWRIYTLYLINASRAEFQLPPLGLDPEPTDLAQVHAEDTATHYDDSSYELRRSSYLMHRSSDRRELGDRVRARGIKNATKFGENVGLRYNASFTDVHGSIEEGISFMHTYMMNEVPPDDGHRQTLLGDFTHVGIGLELHRAAGKEPNTLFLVQDFARFTDGRSVVIPELGPKPQTLSLKREPSTRRIAPPVPAKKRRERMRPGTVQRRRFLREVIVPQKQERTRGRVRRSR